MFPWNIPVPANALYLLLFRGVRFSGSQDLTDCGFSIRPASIENTTEELGFDWECYFTHLPTIDEEEMWSTHKKIRRIILLRFDL